MKKALVFLLILTATMIFVMPAKSYADPQLDILLNIATHARDSLSITISQINNVPAQVSQLYTQGSNETDALAQAVSQQDTDSAKQHFLAAMRYFKQTNDMINSLNATATNDQTKAETRQLQGEIIRLENMGNLLKSIALQNNVDVNFTSFDQMLQTANQDINSGNLSDASAQIQSANEFIVNTHNSITAAAQEQISQRAREFTEQQIARLNVTQSSTVQQNSTGNVNNTSNTQPHSIPQNTTNNPTPNTPPVNGSNIPMTNNPKDMVAELKTLVAQGKVDQAINLIKIIQAYQKEKLTEKTSEAITPTPQSTPVNNTLPTPPSPPANNTKPTTNTTPSTPQSTPANTTQPTPSPTSTTPPVPQSIPVNTTQPTTNNTQPTQPQPHSDQTNEQESKNNEHHEKRHHVTLTPQSTPPNTTLPTPPTLPPANTTQPTPQSTPTNTTLPTPPTLPPANTTQPASQSPPTNTTLPTPPTPQSPPTLPSTNTTQPSPQPHSDQTNEQESKNSDHEKRHDSSSHEKRNRHHED